MEYREQLAENPFARLDIRFREAQLLPKTIPFHSIQAFLSAMYACKEQAGSEYQLHCCIRDIAVIELLFATGMRISELCSLKPSDVGRILRTFKLNHYRLKPVGSVSC